MTEVVLGLDADTVRSIVLCGKAATIESEIAQDVLAKLEGIGESTEGLMVYLSADPTDELEDVVTVVAGFVVAVAETDKVQTEEEPSPVTFGTGEIKAAQARWEEIADSINGVFPAEVEDPFEGLHLVVCGPLAGGSIAATDGEVTDLLEEEPGESVGAGYDTELWVPVSLSGESFELTAAFD